MILTVTPNPAIDVTYSLPALTPGESHRVRSVTERPGGKGLNVSRVLHRMGVATAVTGFFGGHEGEWVLDALRAEDIDVQPVAIRGRTRRTVTLVEDDPVVHATVLNEAGPLTDDGDRRRLGAVVRRLLRVTDVLVISGSLPPGATAAVITDLVTDARAAGVPTLVDTTSDGLLAAARAGATVLKPNVQELGDATRANIDTFSGVIAAARTLLEGGTSQVVVSRGSKGLMSVSTSVVLACPPLPGITGNATGAGDAAVAALAQALVTTRDRVSKHALRTAAAWGAAAVRSPTAGDIDPEIARECHARAQSLRVSVSPTL
jgi:tagatose 6-phosphate kinase